MKATANKHNRTDNRYFRTRHLLFKQTTESNFNFARVLIATTIKCCTNIMDVERPRIFADLVIPRRSQERSSVIRDNNFINILRLTTRKKSHYRDADRRSTPPACRSLRTQNRRINIRFDDSSVGWWLAEPSVPPVLHASFHELHVSIPNN